MDLQQILEIAKSLGFKAELCDDSNEYGYCEYVLIKGLGARFEIHRVIERCEIHGLSIYYEAHIRSYHDIPDSKLLKTLADVKDWLTTNAHFLTLERIEPDLSIFF